jgi:uridine kinase
VKGDKLVVKDEHIAAARRLAEIILPRIESLPGRLVLTIAGESGSGKSELAVALRQELFDRGIRSVILQQDDYFKYPPHTNAELRKRDLSHVGPSEVRLDLLDRHLAEILRGAEEIEKPLVIYEEDRIVTEKLDLKNAKVVIVEGTYTSLLGNVHLRVFIDRTYRETRAARLERAREAQDEFLEKVLEIEHRIISQHRANADVVITQDYRVEVVAEGAKAARVSGKGPSSGEEK